MEIKIKLNIEKRPMQDQFLLGEVHTDPDGDPVLDVYVREDCFSQLYESKGDTDTR